MSAADRLRTVGSWSGLDVDAEAIQAQLTKLWRASGQRARASGEPAAARTNVLTLVVYAGNDATLERAGAAVGALVEHHPSRTILVRTEAGNGQPALAADVVTRCRLDRPQVCHEQIELRASGAHAEQVSSAVASLLLRDLPAYLWWPHDLQEQPALLAQLMDLCDGLIVDSGGFADPRASLPPLLSLLAAQRRSAVADLQWERSARWRDVTAQFFDGPARPFLDGLASVAVQSGGPPAPLPWSALLYVAWLASRLGWSPPTTPGALDRFALATRGAAIQVAIAADRLPAAPPGLATVRLEGRHDNQLGAFAIERGVPDQLTTRATIGDMAAVERTMTVPRPSDATLLSQTLGYFRADPVYAGALRWLAGLLGAPAGARA